MRNFAIVLRHSNTTDIHLDPPKVPVILETVARNSTVVQVVPKIASSSIPATTAILKISPCSPSPTSAIPKISPFSLSTTSVIPKIPKTSPSSLSPTLSTLVQVKSDCTIRPAIGGVMDKHLIVIAACTSVGGLVFLILLGVAVRQKKYTKAQGTAIDH